MALGASLLLAGCGGESGPSRAQFAREADAICRPALAQLRAVKQRIDAAAAGADPDVIFARSAALLREGTAISRAALDRIEALQEPGKTRDAVGAWVASNRRQAALTDALAAAFDIQDETRIAQLSGKIDELEDVNNATARGFGMRSCAERVDT
ncbi:MAG: hypothetical protein M3417_06595 [Actinomycetota bacterium]|nr:hypothetical protein [Actinomycetota bacterium]